MKLSLLTPLFLAGSAVAAPHVVTWEVLVDSRYAQCMRFTGGEVDYPGGTATATWGASGAWWYFNSAFEIRPRFISVSVGNMKHMGRAHPLGTPEEDEELQGDNLWTQLAVDLDNKDMLGQPDPIKKATILGPNKGDPWTCNWHDVPNIHLDCFNPRTKLEVKTGGADGNITSWEAEICAFHCDGDTPNFDWVKPGELPQYSSLQSTDGGDLDPLDGFPTEPVLPAGHSGPDRRQLHQTLDDCSHEEGCAICGGEPHFRTFAGDWFDFMGGCDLVLLSSPNFGNGLGLDIHVRTKVRYSYSYIETAVLRLGNDLLEVDSFGAYKVNGVEGAALRKPGLIGFMEGFPIYHTHSKEDTKKHTFDVVLSARQNITFTTFKDFVSVRPMGGEAYPLTGSVGVLGDYNTGLMLGRNGWTIYEDPIEFGLEWQVKDTDPKLFVTDDFPQYPQQCVFPDKATMEKRQLGEAGISRDEAEEACAHHTNAEDRANCVYDVLATGDYEMAKEDYAF